MDPVTGKRESVAYGVADPSCWAVISGPSIAETLMRNGVTFRRADNARVSIPKKMGGWSELRARLKGDGEGKPLLFVFSTCRDLIRTLPMLVHDDATRRMLIPTGRITWPTPPAIWR